MNLPNNVSEATKRRNPHLYPQNHPVGAVGKPKRKHGAQSTLGRNLPGRPRRQERLVVIVTLIRCGARQLDGDNLQAGLKPLRDSIARSLGIDDNDPRVAWEYGQAAATGTTRGTIVKMDLV